MKVVIEFLMKIFKFFSLEVEGFDILNSTEVLRRRNIIVNRVLLFTNIFVTIITLTNPTTIPLYQSISLLIPTFAINFLIWYFVTNNKDSQEKQILGMYVAVLSVSYLAFRLYFMYPSTYSYLFIYFALAIIALFQNRHAMILGGLLVFAIASIFHFNEIFNLGNDSSLFTLISSEANALRDVTILSLILLLYIFVLTSMVIFSEYMDKERKIELQKRSNLEREFKAVLFNVFDTIDDFTKVSSTEELTDDYTIAIMAKKLALLMGESDDFADRVFQFAIATGLNYDFSVDYDEMAKENLLKDYERIKYKLNAGSALLKRMRLKMKADSLVRSRYEAGWLLSDSFKRMQSEDTTLENQIVLLCSVYVILREKQSYKKPIPHVKAIKELSDHFAHFYDERVLKVFFDNHVEFEIIFEKVSP